MALRRIYATRDDLVTYAPDEIMVPDNENEILRLLARASELVEDLTLGAVYPVDEQGIPTDDEDIEAMRQATCAQAVAWLESGDESDTAGQWATVSIGSISLSRITGNSAANTSAASSAPESVARPLRLAGLLPAAVTHY